MYQNIYFEQEAQKIHLWDDKDGYSSFPFKGYAYVKAKTSVGTVFTIFGDTVKKVQRWSKQDEADGNVFESDVPVLTRVLVDEYTDSDEVPIGHKIAVLDIEVSAIGGFPNIQEADKEVNAIGLWDESGQKLYGWVLNRLEKRENYVDGQEVLTFVETEEDLLSQFLLKYAEIKPTILTGWNIDKFDIPYLYRRMKRILGGEFANMLSPISLVEWSDFKEQYQIAGVSVLDYLGLYKKFTYTQESSYNLDAIGQKEVKMGKVKYEGSLDKLYATDLKKFIEYNLQDVKIVHAIDQKMQLINLAIMLSHKAHTPYQDVYFNSRVIDGAILTHLKRLKIVAPSKKFRSMDDARAAGLDEIPGAYVMEPIPGRYEWIFDLDMTSLYPSVIMSLNISPETKIGKVNDWDAEAYVKDELPIVTFDSKGKSKRFSGQELKEFLEAHQYSIASNGVVYSTETLGLIPSILNEWFKERIEYKNLMKKHGKENDKPKYEYFKHKQLVIKTLLNSVYGVLGLPVFRFFDSDNASAVTTTGVTIIKFAQRMVNQFYGHELGKDADYCIYMDTDSTFFSSLPMIKYRFPTADYTNEDFMVEQTIKIAGEVQVWLNKAFDFFAMEFLNLKEHRFDIKQEVIARSGIWVAKKRYAHWIINDNGVKLDKLEVKGLDTVRSNFPKAFKGLLKEILTMILKGNPKSEIDEKILAFKKNLPNLDVREIAKPTSVKGISKYAVDKRGTKLMKGSTDIFRKAVKGTPAHVKAAINYNNFIVYMGLDKNFEPLYESEKIRWTYLKDNPFGIDEIAFRGYEDPPELMEFVVKYIDVTKIYEHELESKLQDVFSAMSWGMPSQSAKKFAEFFDF